MKKTEIAESAEKTEKTETAGNAEKSKKKKKKKNKKRRAVIFLIIFFILGLLVFLYPVFTKFFISHNTDREVDGFKNEMERIISEAVENGELDEDYAGTDGAEPLYMRVLKSEEPPEHQPYMDRLYQFMKRRNKELFETSQSELNSEESYLYPEFTLKYYGVRTDSIGTLEIDRLGLDLSVYLGANDVNLAIGSGHLTNTSYYLGGKNTSCVIAVHRGLGGADFLRYVNKLQKGDVVKIRNFWYTLEYKVSRVKITEPDDVKSICIQPEKDMLILYTCHPYGINTQRYIVYCERVTE